MQCNLNYGTNEVRQDKCVGRRMTPPEGIRDCSGLLSLYTLTLKDQTTKKQALTSS
jgi:hypothetical protein